MEKFKVVVRATSIVITPGKEASSRLGPLLSSLIYEDEYVEETKSLGFMYDEESDTLFLHKGVDVKFVCRLLMNVEVEYNLYDKYRDMDFEFEELIAPRNEEQSDAINFIAGIDYFEPNKDVSQIFLVKAPGFGKAEPYSRKIPAPTENGYIFMGDIKVGDEVFDRTGGITKVTEIFEQGEQDVYEITFQDGRHAFCTKEHLWNVSVDGSNEYKTLSTNDMMQNFYAVNGKYRYAVPSCGFVEYPEIKLPNNLRKYILHYSLHRFCLPTEYLVNSIDNRLSVIQTLMYLNGNITDDEIVLTTFTTKFIHLAKQFIWLLNSFGFSGILSEYGGLYVVTCNVPDWFKQHMVFPDEKEKIDISKFKHNSKNGYYDIPITNIRFSHKEMCKCITTDNPEHLYLTEDFIVTHNTFCTGYGIGLYGKKALIIMHRDSLRAQWFKSLFKMNGFDSNHVHEISSSDELYQIAHNGHNYDYDIYLMTHATFRAGLKRIGNMKDAMNIGKNLGIGIKVIDEAHLEFKDTLLIDFVFNVKRNLYLTATDGRSQRDENSIFKYVFSNSIYYKPSSLLNNEAPKKWVNYVTVRVNTHCNPNLYRYRVNGGRGMTPVSYGKWVIEYDKKKTHFKCCRDIVKECFNRDQNAKILILIPLIDLCEKLSDFLIHELKYDDSFKYDPTIRTITSRNSKGDNLRNQKADIIVSTIGSTGTGTDIGGLTDIIVMSPLVSHITSKQVFGRIRYNGKQGHYYDIIDESVPMDRMWWKSRSRTLKHLALNTMYLDWDEE